MADTKQLLPSKLVVMASSNVFLNPFAFASQKVVTLIDDSNFLTWKQHVLLMVKTYRLQHYLDGTVVVPTSTVANDDRSLVENPTFVQYEQQDAAISAWLLSTVSPSLD
ncbi:hypothetical protein J1N35_004177 [Gossypium stocksii]|uniref:Retrotransposon Copia-like N-terminal domain-containing protein n=1 Tax=Gossypium stocksii TaxID=47602 RepID=A0A9D3WBJ7_9ROSI|nr:hypothetical protein J1N35_004177 [Gossypium stocksii]